MTKSVKWRNNRVWFAVAMCSACVAVLGAAWTLWAAVRVTASVPDKAALNELPRIAELVQAPPSTECFYTMISAPHGSRVCVIGTSGDFAEFKQVFAFLDGIEPTPGADVLIASKAPGALVNTANARDSFDADDPYWMCDAPNLSDGRSFPVYIAYDLDSNRYYLEYRWAH